jgi:hypothetical protein
VRALLDVNVLIALLDEAHVHHGLAREWLGANVQQGWASCPLTQLGCVRIMSNPRYANVRPAAQVAQRLAKATRTSHHEFWAADADPLGGGGIEWSRVLSARHVTDAYLLSLAVARDGRFVTFDQHVPWQAVPGAQARHRVVLGQEEDSTLISQFATLNSHLEHQALLSADGRLKSRLGSPQ